MEEDLRELWTTMKPTALARCELIERAASTGDVASFDEARADAHRLAGALGMYGLDEASDLAIRLDQLVVDGALADGRRDDVAALARALHEAVEDER